MPFTFGSSSESLQSCSQFPRPYFSGPLEGSENYGHDLFEDLSDAIKAQLGDGQVGATSFTALANSALIFRIDSEHVESAANTLKSCNYHLQNIKERSELVSTLKGLAHTAAVTRSCLLADELKIMVRRYREDSEHPLSIQDAMNILLVSAASRKSLPDWCVFVGEGFTEMAFGDLKSGDGTILYSYLCCLLQIVPELWATCGKADAALIAYNEV